MDNVQLNANTVLKIPHTDDTAHKRPEQESTPPIPARVLDTYDAYRSELGIDDDDTETCSTSIDEFTVLRPYKIDSMTLSLSIALFNSLWAASLVLAPQTFYNAPAIYGGLIKHFAPVIWGAFLSVSPILWFIGSWNNTSKIRLIGLTISLVAWFFAAILQYLQSEVWSPTPSALVIFSLFALILEPLNPHANFPIQKVMQEVKSGISHKS